MISLKEIDGSLSDKIKVKGITCDSRDVREGYIFFAIEGEINRGEDYIEEAINKGACAIVTSDSYSKNLTVPVVKKNNPRKFLSNKIGRAHV